MVVIILYLYLWSWSYGFDNLNIVIATVDDVNIFNGDADVVFDIIDDDVGDTDIGDSGPGVSIITISLNECLRLQSIYFR